MRTKSILVRSSRKSLDPYPSLPEEANGKFDSYGVSSVADDEIVRDTFDERDVPHKKRHCLGTRGESELLNLDACFVCEVSDESVSRCSGTDCILSFHGECANAEFGSSEDLANPYCSYCWFKTLALKSKLLREKAVEAEKAVFKYLDKEMKSRDETNLSGDENGNQERSVERTDIVSDQELEKDACSSEEELEKDSDQSRGENTPLIEETDRPEEDKGKLDNEVEASEDEERVATENFQDAEEDDETAKDQTKVNTGARKKGDASPFLSMQESFSGKEHQHNVKQTRSRRRRLILNATDSEISSNESTNERNGEDVTEQITSSAQVTSPSEQRKLSAATTKAAKSKTVRDISFFSKDQRRRLFWTTEEEEMLKVGVEKFAAEANKNMPWRKILEMGEKVFHETRTPADLKDKWRNMNKKTTH